MTLTGFFNHLLLAVNNGSSAITVLIHTIIASTSHLNFLQSLLAFSLVIHFDFQLLKAIAQSKDEAVFAITYTFLSL